MPTKREAKRDWTLTAKGTKYTYPGWVRAYHAALTSGIPNLAYRLASAYPAHYDTYMERARTRDLGSRQHAPNPGKPKPARTARTARTAKSSAKRPAFGVQPPKPSRKAQAKKAQYTPKQRALMREIFHYERDMERATDRLLAYHDLNKAADSPEAKQVSALRGKQREAERKLYRLSKSAAADVQTRLTERNDKYHNRRARDAKKKRAFEAGRFTAGHWQG